MWNPSENQVELLLIRHGKTKGNEEKRYIGITDEPLSAVGKRELEDKHYAAPEELFISPMERCRQTAQLLFPGMEASVIEAYKEMNFGSFEGKNYEELSGNPDYQAWIDSNGTLPFPEGEGRDAFCSRVIKGFTEMMDRAEHKHLAAVVHGGTIMAILSSIGTGDYFDYQVANGCGFLCLIEKRPEGYSLVEARSVE